MALIRPASFSPRLIIIEEETRRVGVTHYVRPAKLGLSSHRGWTGRIPSLIICARSSKKTFSSAYLKFKEQ